MRRETQNLLLVLLGQSLLKIAFDGTYVRYVKPALLPWLVAAGLVIVLVGTVSIVLDVRRARVEKELGDCDHQHSSRSPWMLLLPVFAIFLVAPPALGADSVNRAGNWSPTASNATAAPLQSLPGQPPPLLKVSDFLMRSMWDEKGGSLAGRTVRLQGFVVHSKKDPGVVQIVRMRIGCCAADATAIRIDLGGPAAAEAASFPADTWIEVTGQLRPGSATDANDRTPTVDITGLRQIKQPENPYEY